MRTPQGLLRRLIEHQGSIDTVLDRAEGSLRTDRLDALDIGRTRWELARVLAAYQHFKHNELFDPLIARGAPAQALRARRMKTACIRLGVQFRAYLILWGSCDILDDWARYQPDAIAMMQAIRAHLLIERRETALLTGEARVVA